MQDHVLRPRQAFDFGDEVTIGGRDAVSSSSAFVSDRLGSLSYHKPDHPTLNAAAALGPTRANCRWRSVSACRPPVQTNCTRPSEGVSFLIRFFNGAFLQRNRAYGGRFFVRGRSPGKTGPPGNGFTPVRGGAINFPELSGGKYDVPR